MDCRTRANKGVIIGVQELKWTDPEPLAGGDPTRTWLGRGGGGWHNNTNRYALCTTSKQALLPPSRTKQAEEHMGMSGAKRDATTPHHQMGIDAMPGKWVEQHVLRIQRSQALWPLAEHAEEKA
jgi:hypothetical protein